MRPLITGLAGPNSRRRGARAPQLRIRRLLPWSPVRRRHIVASRAHLIHAAWSSRCSTFDKDAAGADGVGCINTILLQIAVLGGRAEFVYQRDPRWGALPRWRPGCLARAAGQAAKFGYLVAVDAPPRKFGGRAGAFVSTGPGGAADGKDFDELADLLCGHRGACADGRRRRGSRGRPRADAEPRG